MSRPTGKAYIRCVQVEWISWKEKKKERTAWNSGSQIF